MSVSTKGNGFRRSDPVLRRLKSQVKQKAGLLTRLPFRQVFPIRKSVTERASNGLAERGKELTAAGTVRDSPDSLLILADRGSERTFHADKYRELFRIFGNGGEILIFSRCSPSHRATQISLSRAAACGERKRVSNELRASAGQRLRPARFCEPQRLRSS